jgi:3-methyl-2-oxobutanoate hydroxymethyltransferase
MAATRRIEIRMSHVSQLPLDRVTVPALQRWKQVGQRIVMTIAYKAVRARIADSL